MSRWNLLALLLGLCLLTAPFIKTAYADEYGDDDDDDEEGGAAKVDDEEKDVVVLTNKNFDSIIKKSKYALVEFYAPWCGHCKNLKPHYAKAATALKKSVPEAVIAKLDATAEAEAAAKFKIEGYPTIKWFVDGELASDYNGGRDADGIIKWVSKKAGPPAVTATDVDQLKELEASNGLLVVGYFSAFEGDAYALFKATAQKNEDAVFVETTSADVAAAAGITAAPGLVAIKNFEGEGREVITYPGEISDGDKIKEFILSEKLPLTIEFNQGNSDKIFNSGIQKQVIFWATAADLAPGAEKITALKAVSKKFKGKLVFVTVNSEGESAEPVTNFFGLKDAEPPKVVGFFMEKNKKYSMEGDFSAEAVEAFAQAVLDGTATAQFKSAPIPEDNKDADVTIVVGKTVNDIVLDPKRDVLLEVYAPWCGHCKKLEPIYKKLAKRFKKVDSVVIAKMDGTENEHPDIEVKGFPTIMFYPAGESKTPIVFEGGDRSLKALTKFIKQHAAIPYELPKKGSEESEASGGSGHDEL